MLIMQFSQVLMNMLGFGLAIAGAGFSFYLGIAAAKRLVHKGK